jgi:type IV pilus assembly protein PilX
MRSHRPRMNIPAKQRGVVLFVALILLFILSLLGVTAARMQTAEERMARNEDNRQIGAQAAEAALRTAEAGLTSGAWSAAQFSGNSNGLYVLNASAGSVVSSLNWSAPTAAIPAAPGYAPNPGPALTSLPAAAQTPMYVIESLPAVAIPGESINQVQYAAPTTPVAVYRVTANGSGADSSSSTLLQSIYR